VSAGENEFPPPVTCVMSAGTCDPLSTNGKRRSMVSNSRKPHEISSGEERAMSVILIFTVKWHRWYRVLRHGHGFGLFNSVRYGLWLARG
jgi:hypothetical protein